MGERRPPGGRHGPVPRLGGSEPLADERPDDAPYDEGEVLRRPAGVAADSPALALVGRTVVGRYRLGSVLGEGGTGAVFDARDLEHGARVALKLLTGVTAREPAARARFVREVRAATKIESAHVVTVLDVGDDPELGLYIAMERLVGEDLGARIARRGKLRAVEAVTIGSQIAVALDAAHRQGVIHRDLKPQNVFLCRRPDGTLFVKVVDFGVAKLARDARRIAPGAIARSGMAVGTPQYMSPEQAQVMIVDARADVYALGAVVYEMLVGVPPVPLLPYEQTIVHIVLKGAARLLPGPTVPAPLARLVNEMLASRKDDRPGSAGEVHVRLASLASELGDVVTESERTPRPAELVSEGGPESARSRALAMRRGSAEARDRRRRARIDDDAARARDSAPSVPEVIAAAPASPEVRELPDVRPSDPPELAREEPDEEVPRVVEPVLGRGPLLVVAVSLGVLLVIVGARDLLARRAAQRHLLTTDVAASMPAWTTPSVAPVVTATASATPEPTATASATPAVPVVAATAASATPVVTAAVAKAAPNDAPPADEKPPVRSTGSRVGDARIALERGDTARAIALAKDVIATDRGRADAWLVLGAAHEMAGRPAEARAAYTHCASGRGPASAECQDLLGR